MSLETTVERPEGSRPERSLGRVQRRLQQWRDNPNPLWMREMRQAARVQGTPVALASLTLLMTFLIGSIGGLRLAETDDLAEIGHGLFQVFFSLAYFVVALVGPALGANSIAAEREGNTWEALLLTGLRPHVVARGKFLSAYTLIGIYIVMLAPVGALPFLFGGVTPGEVLIGFVLLFLIALVTVGFGLALSAKMQSTRGALVIAMLAAVPLSGFAFGFLGFGGRELARSEWGYALRSGALWLPEAYTVAPFDFRFVYRLLIGPAVVLGLPAWLLYEIILANLLSVTEDRSFGLKRWHVVTTLLLTLFGIVSVLDQGPGTSVLTAFSFVFVIWLTYMVFASYLFATEPIGPSRRMERALSDGGRLRRWFGPGVLPTVPLLQWTARSGLFLLASAALLVAHVRWHSGTPMPNAFAIDAKGVGVSAFYMLGFTEFVIGLTAWLRSRSSGATGVRWVLLAVVFLLIAGPWMLVALSGQFVHGAQGSLIMAAPSPVYVVTIAVPGLLREAPTWGDLVAAAMLVGAVYLISGLALVRSARRRCEAIIRDHQALLVDADARLAKEDEAAARTAAVKDPADGGSSELAEAAREWSPEGPRNTDRSA